MRRCFYSRGFTLVELMVSMAIALLLVLGINQIFKKTSQTVGEGESLLNAGRDARSVERTFFNDLNNIAAVAGPNSTTGDPICLIIQSQHVYAYRNLDDQKGAANQTDPSTDPLLFPTGASSPWLPNNQSPIPSVNPRSHRIDKFGLFARGLFSRQTSSNSTQFMSPTSSGEAWIVYEHASQPNRAEVIKTGSGKWFNPGDYTATAPTNDFNYFSCDWMLARNAILLVPTPNTSTDPVYIQDTGGLTPLTPPSTASGAPSGEDSTLLYNARLDIAQTSISAFGNPKRAGGLGSYGVANRGQNWWDQMIGGGGYAQRYQASPFILVPKGNSATAPKISPFGTAKSSPNLIRGCTQFIVEYAGNFYTKDTSKNNGYPSATLNDGSGKQQLTPVPDATGTLDYYVDPNDPNKIRHLRWYGYPRLVTFGTNMALGNINLDVSYGTGGNGAADAVIPLRDVLEKMGSLAPTPQVGWGAYADAERFSTSPAFPAIGSNYWTSLLPSTEAPTNYQPYTYTAAWGPDNTQPFPKMIRIVICIDDHEGRLSHPQFYEYVFDVQQ